MLSDTYTYIYIVYVAQVLQINKQVTYYMPTTAIILSTICVGREGCSTSRVVPQISTHLQLCTLISALY